MSSARTKSGDHRSYLGDAIVEELRASRLPLGPRQFEFWFAHKGGHNAALNAASNAIRAANGTFTGEDIARLHQAHLSPWRMAGDADATTTRLTGRLDDIALSLDGAMGVARAQGEVLAAEAAQLHGDRALTLRDLLGTIDRLAQATKESQARYARLEARMDAAVREIGTLQQQLSAVRSESQRDPATALPNRTAFNEALDAALTEAAETRRPLSVALCDLDHFGTLNERFGKLVGDEVLQTIGLRLKAQLRPGDTVARFGGDAFAVIAPQIRASDAVAYLERFRQMLMSHQMVERHDGAGRVTISIGVADAIKGDTSDYLLRRAHKGLTVAKRQGRNRVVEMTPDGPIWNSEEQT